MVTPLLSGNLRTRQYSKPTATPCEIVKGNPGLGMCHKLWLIRPKDTSLGWFYRITDHDLKVRGFRMG